MTSKIEGVIKKGQNVNVSKLRKFSPLKNVFKNSYRKLIGRKSIKFLGR